MSLKFNPLHYNNQKSLTLSRNLDPDSNFSGDSLNCVLNLNFYTENSLNNMLSNKTTNMNCLSFMHLNMRSLCRNLNQLQQLLVFLISPRHQEPCPRRQEPCPRRQEPCPRHQEPCPRHQEPCPRRQEPCPQHQEPCPQRQEPCPQRQGPCPQHQEPCPQRQEPCPQRQEPCPQRREPCPQRQEARKRPPKFLLLCNRVRSYKFDYRVSCLL